MNFFKTLEECAGLKSPVVYVDVGAMGGIPQYWNRLGSLCRTIAFEPDERALKDLKNTAHKMYLPYALADTSRALIFYIAKDQGKSSIYQPNMPLLECFPDAKRFTTVRTVSFPKEKVKAMDEALMAHNVKDVDFIKLDTQGSELDILKGAQSTLPHTFGCEIEVEFCELYQKQPLFSDVDNFMRGHGFDLVDVRRAFWKKAAWGKYIGRGQLVFGDALYLRSAAGFSDRISGLDSQERVSKIKRAIVICMVYGLPDHAVDLLNLALERKFLNEEMHHRIMDCVQAEALSWGGPRVWPRPLVSKVFNRLSEMFRPASYGDFADGDRFIGNVRNI